MKKNYIHLLLATTLLTACGNDGGNPVDNKTAQGVTPDGSTGEEPTIAGTGANKIVEQVIARNSEKLQPLRNDILRAGEFARAKETPEEIKQVLEFIPSFFEHFTPFLETQTEIYQTLSDRYKEINV